METLESSRVCRLCGKQSGISIDIFDGNENHVRKINAVLPIMVHEMDMLPKHMCHRCSYKLEEFHKFYVECLKTDANLKSQLSWMRDNDDSQKMKGVPMVQIENVKIKAEPLDYDLYELDKVNYINMNPVSFPVEKIQNCIHQGITYAYARCQCFCSKSGNNGQKNFQKSFIGRNEVPNVKTTRAVSRGLLNTSLCEKIQSSRKTSSNNDSFTIIKDSNTMRDASEKSNNPSTTDQNNKSNTSTEPKIVDRRKKPFSNATNISSTQTGERKLRPRKMPFVYVGNRQKSRSVNLEESKVIEEVISDRLIPPSEIKIEFEETEIRVLRPRTKHVNYLAGKRKYANRSVKIKKEKEDQDLECESISSNVLSSVEKIVTQDNQPSVIKQETLESTEQFNEDLAFKDDVKVESRECVDAAKNTKKKMQSVGQKSLKKSLRLDVPTSPKYLRSQDGHLRNGKIKKIENPYLSKKLRKCLSGTKTLNKHLSKVFVKNILTKKVSTLINSSDCKCYCEMCNQSFLNKELFRLHVCQFD